jgi:hypothetical protein
VRAFPCLDSRPRGGRSAIVSALPVVRICFRSWTRALLPPYARRSCCRTTQKRPFDASPPICRRTPGHSVELAGARICPDTLLHTAVSRRDGAQGHASSLRGQLVTDTHRHVVPRAPSVYGIREHGGHHHARGRHTTASYGTACAFPSTCSLKTKARFLPVTPRSRGSGSV